MRTLLYAALTLFAAQYLGDLIADTFSLPIPGVVIGLLLLLLVLVMRGQCLGHERAVPPAMGRVAKCLQEHFGLLFVPAGVGVVAHISRLLAEGPALIVALLLSTIATIAVTSLIVAGWRGAVALRDVSEGEQHGT